MSDKIKIQSIDNFFIFTEIREGFYESFDENFRQQDLVEWVRELYETEWFEENYDFKSKIKFEDINFCWMYDVMSTDVMYNI